MVRYYGLYANAHRGKMRKTDTDPLCPLIIENEDPFIPSKGWAEMIKKVYEIDPLICPKCGEGPCELSHLLKTLKSRAHWGLD